MTEWDYKLINLKYSCPLLKRDDIAEGKVPTAPTISSIVAGLQTQEALKLLHGLPVRAGAALVFNGESNNFYITEYQRKRDCLSHETYGAPVDVPLGAADSVEALLAATRGKRLLLDRDLLLDLSCPKCRVKTDVARPLALVSLREGRCPECRGIMATNMVHSVERDTALARRALQEVGVAPYDIVKVETSQEGLYARLAKDRVESMGWR
jgi:adenylyltransferase/sulfurtransferase